MKDIKEKYNMTTGVEEVLYRFMQDVINRLENLEHEVKNADNYITKIEDYIASHTYDKYKVKTALENMILSQGGRQ